MTLALLKRGTSTQQTDFDKQFVKRSVTVGPSQEQLRLIMQCGILAPSADNKINCRFECLPDRLRLWATEDFICAQYYRKVLSLMSFGAMVENMLQCAASYKLKCEVVWFPKKSNPAIIVEIVWAGELPTLPANLFDSIGKRHTNRRLYSGESLPAETLTALAQEIQSFPGIQLHWFPSHTTKELISLMRVAETDRFRQRDLHQEIFNSIRFDVGWTRTCEEGLAPGSLEVDGAMKLFFPLLRFWPLTRLLNLFGNHYILGFRAGWLPVWFSSHIGVLSIESKCAPEDIATQVGQAFERVWLKAASMDLSIQPMAAAAMLLLQEPVEGMVSETVKSKLQNGLQQSLLAGRTPLMLFRLGIAQRPTIASSRKSLESYL